METILSITNLCKTYGKVQAVKNVSLEIQKGNVYGILGPNGSGKSTTLGIVLNVVNKTSGNYSWFGGNLQTHEALKKVGAIIERPNFYPYMTAQQNLQLVCKIKSISTEKIAEKLTIVGLNDRKDSKFSTFSLGMKQRLAIASALLNDPEILILDEPTNGLDPQGIHQIRDIIKLIAAQGTTILLASHLLDEVEKVCSHVLVLKKGTILYSGLVNQMSSKSDYLELQANDNEIVLKLLKNYPNISNVTHENGKILVFSNTKLFPSEINKYLADQQCYLNHIIIKKQSLEEQFLELTAAATTIENSKS